MGEVVPLFGERRKKRRIEPPPMPVGHIEMLIGLDNRDHNAACHELAEITAILHEALGRYQEKTIMDCKFAEEMGEA